MDKNNKNLKLILNRLDEIEQKILTNEQAGSRKTDNFDGILDIVQGLSKFFSIISSAGISLVGIVYIFGFFIVNSYLSQYGTYSLSLIRSQYLATGIFALLMSGVVFVPELVFISGIFQVHFWRTTVLSTSATCTLMLLLFILQEPTVENVVIAMVPFLILFVGNQIIAIALMGWIWIKRGKKVVVKSIKSGFSAAATAIILLVTVFGYIYFFSKLTYPLVKPVFGGGYPQLVQFYGYSENFYKLQDVGIPLTKTIHTDTVLAQNVLKTSYTIPLYLLNETQNNYLVTDRIITPGFEIFQFGMRQGASFQISKNDASGVLYLSKTDSISPLLVLIISIALFLIVSLTGRLGIRIFWPLFSRLFEQRKKNIK